MPLLNRPTDRADNRMKYGCYYQNSNMDDINKSHVCMADTTKG